MATAMRMEVNLIRLLGRCETMAADRNPSDWRLTKYIETLNDYMSSLRKLTANIPSTEALTDYTRRVELLKGIMEAEKMQTASEKSLAVEFLPSSKQLTSADAGSRDLHNQTKARYQKDIREELFGKSDSSSDNVLTHRHHTGGVDNGVGGDGSRTTEDVDLLLKHHRVLQEKLAEDMVYLARSLKENARAAGRIVRDDKEKIIDSSRLADQNYGRLKIESDRLEYHANKACSWWILIMLVVVIAVFVWMVVFMKMFSKK